MKNINVTNVRFKETHLYENIISYKWVDEDTSETIVGTPDELLKLVYSSECNVRVKFEGKYFLVKYARTLSDVWYPRTVEAGFLADHLLKLPEF